MQTTENPLTPFLEFISFLMKKFAFLLPEGDVARSKLISLEVVRISLVCQAVLPGVNVLTRNKHS
jgi:hypothetical protein